ncbi:MAG: DNA modification methylase, partial [Chloroflexota bacterium]
ESFPPTDVPKGEFWELAYHSEVLDILCRLREGLMADNSTDARKALVAIILGALHGPKLKTTKSYFSNQSQRTYSPKPKYAIRYWTKHNHLPEFVDVMRIIKERADRYYSDELETATGKIILGDSRQESIFDGLNRSIDWVITSPPYYGMRTYLPDQWLRWWFVGGPDDVEYSNKDQLEHESPETFVSQLQTVWENVGSIANSNARMVIRFGGLNSRKVDHLPLIKESLQNTNWRTDTVISAGFASNGNRQAVHMKRKEPPKEEYDLWATWCGD